MSDEAQVETIISSPQISPDAESSEVTHRRSQSLPLGQVNSREVGSPSSSLRPKRRSLLLDHFRGNILDPSSPDIRNGVHAAKHLDVNEAMDEWGLLTRRSPSERSEISIRSPRGVIDMAPSPFFRVELCANGLEVTIFIETLSIRVIYLSLHCVSKNYQLSYVFMMKSNMSLLTSSFSDASYFVLFDNPPSLTPSKNSRQILSNLSRMGKPVTTFTINVSG